jgi:hypothetical protein
MEQEALIIRAREDAKRIVSRLKLHPHSSAPALSIPPSAADAGSVSPKSQNSLAGRIIRNTEIQEVEVSPQEAEIAMLRARVQELERLILEQTEARSVTGAGRLTSGSGSRSWPSKQSSTSIVKEVAILEKGIW